MQWTANFLVQRLYFRQPSILFQLSNKYGIFFITLGVYPNSFSIPWIPKHSPFPPFYKGPCVLLPQTILILSDCTLAVFPQESDNVVESGHQLPRASTHSQMTVDVFSLEATALQSRNIHIVESLS